jgi:hypothetical protein
MGSDLPGRTGTIILHSMAKKGTAGVAKFEFQARQTEDIIQLIGAFVGASVEWRMLEKESAEYTRGIGRAALMTAYAVPGQYAGATVAIAESDDVAGKAQIYNIVPNQGDFTAQEYHCLGRLFTFGFRRFCKSRRLRTSARIITQKSPHELHEIIPGNRTRRFFEQFLVTGQIWGTPTTAHPNDIEKLDVFISALHRYRARVHILALKEWLIREKRWPAKDANWTCQRIEMGRAILSVNQRF